MNKLKIVIIILLFIPNINTATGNLDSQINLKIGSNSNFKDLINYRGPYEENTTVRVALFDSTINDTTFKNNLLINQKEIPNDSIDNENNGLIDDITGWNFVDNNNIITDESNNSHGTISALIIKDLYNNVQFLPEVILDNNGQLKNVNLLEQAFNYAIDRQVNIINIPIYVHGLDLTSKNIINNLIQTAWTHGIIVVNSVGNYAQLNRTISELTTMEHTVGVGSVSNNLTKSTFSQYGNYVDIVAPGESININGQDWSGTSISCSIISGSIANLINANNLSTNGKILDFLYRTATDINATKPNIYTGNGIVNVDLGIKSINDNIAPKVTKINNSFIEITDNVGLYQVIISNPKTNITLLSETKLNNKSIIINLDILGKGSQFSIYISDYKLNSIRKEIDDNYNLNFSIDIVIFVISIISYKIIKKFRYKHQ